MRAELNAASTEAQAPTVYIVILNWNNWRVTLECLESVFRLRYPAYKVIVCDNDSQDGSVELFEAWARGEVCVVAEDASAGRHIAPPVQKPIPHRTIEGGLEQDVDTDRPLTILRTGGNLGFAGGNNVGIRFALRSRDMEYVWLLNNDAVADPGALTALVARVSQDSRIGMCGSTILDYPFPHRIQALGGATYRRWIGLARVLKPENASMENLKGLGVAVERCCSYVVGASMLVSREFLEQVGLLSEDYFLYFEELDWARRATPRYKLGYAPESIVLHRLGTSTGQGEGSYFYHYQLHHSRLRFMRKFDPWALPFAYLQLIFAIGKAYVTGRRVRAKAMLDALLGRRLAGPGASAR
jgi:GT2 family glycosyltransferase